MADGRKQINNHGFSLIELIVAIAISGVIVILVGSLMINSSKWFSSETAKSAVQNELQDVSEKLDSVLMEAVSITIEKSGGVTYIYTGDYDESTGVWKNATGTERVIIQKGNNLWLRTVKPEDIDNQDKGYLLTDKVSSFDIAVNDIKNWPAGGTSKTTDGYVTNPVSVNVKLELLYRKRSVGIDKDIRLRNKISKCSVSDSTGVKVYEVISKTVADKLN